MLLSPVCVSRGVIFYSSTATQGPHRSSQRCFWIHPACPHWPLRNRTIKNDPQYHDVLFNLLDTPVWQSQFLICCTVYKLIAGPLFLITVHWNVFHSVFCSTFKKHFKNLQIFAPFRCTALQNVSPRGPAPTKILTSCTLLTVSWTVTSSKVCSFRNCPCVGCVDTPRT